MIINDLIINVELETVLNELQAQLVSRGIPYLQKLHDSGNDIMVQCPYHGNGQERRPSAGIRKSDGVFHCFACGETYSLPEVISYCFGYDDILGKYGTQWLVNNFMIISKEERKGVKLNMERPSISSKSSILDNSDIDKPNYVTEEELDSYRYYHEYWTKRGITDDDIIELFDLGYDKKTDCITFPVRDIDGNCLFVARRSVKTKWFNYPKDVEKPLYGLYELKKSFMQQYEGISDFYYGAYKLYITESMIDCILLWQAGKYAVALNGTGSKEQLEVLKKLPCRHLILTTDNDKAGMLAREKIRKNVSNKLYTEVNFPEGIKDIGECTLEQIKNIERWEIF